MGCQKLGQSLWEFNFCAGSNSGEPHFAHSYIPVGLIIGYASKRMSISYLKSKPIVGVIILGVDLDSVLDNQKSQLF